MKKTKHKTFETERLFIRPTTLEDAAFILELFNSPKWRKFIGDRNIKTVKHAKVYISNKIQPQLEKSGFSNYTVIRKADGFKIGSCGLYDREGLDNIDIGFAFLPKFEKKGYAFEATSEIKRAAKEEFELRDLSAITLEENLDSTRLLEKLGFKLKNKFHLPDDPEELLLYHLKF